MPAYLHLPPVAQGVLALSAVAFAIVRLLTASRPFWASTPAWAQKALPALAMAIAAVPAAIEHARSWLDVVVAFVVSGAMFYTASRGDKRAPLDTDGTPRTERVNSDPKIDETVRIIPPTGPLLVLLFCCSLPALHGCGSHVNWPRVLQCAAPLEGPVVQSVASILAGTGDVKIELEGLAGQYGAATLECAVQQIIGDVGTAPVTARASRQAVRGRAFLESVLK